jgi:uncharacterized protein (DUF427 family)
MPSRSEAYQREREKWRNFPRVRPAQIVAPGPGQESVWDYPRPPRVEPVTARVRVEFEGLTIADTVRALRVCETSSPPCYYVPQVDILMERLAPSERTSFCEWKGLASYWSVRVEGFEPIRDYIGFYPRRMDGCWVGADRVTPQPGVYYGGWVTPNLVGPFKGVPGSESW